MHIDFAALAEWAVIIFRGLQQLLGFGKGALESAKIAKDIFTDVESQIGSKDEKEKEQGFERARIASELMRSYALFGALEYLYRTTTTLLLLLILREAHKMFREAFRNQKK